ncbi:MAG: HPF/RaiA family ribosome-associated protein [Gemmatimonadetes bacterium]|nr:HPF/RaiA family ribosome-associated protein [Gemmatimonadota bacterium]MCC6774380.1 HPF/RaiA family ribosome-associated protein [Gemmatimonadaceae bacterium]
MEVVFHAHNAVISDRMQERASRGLSRIAQRVERAVDATVRFHQDGPLRRVEIRLNAPGQRDLIAQGHSRYYGPALKIALAHLESQVEHTRRAPKGKSRGDAGA